MFSAKKLPRLGQWNGRRRSSREDEPLLRWLAKPAVLLRLAVVGVTTVLVTALAIWWGPPFPYRVGEIYPHDLRARLDFEVINNVELYNRLDPGGKVADRPVVEKYERGTVIVPAGQPIQERQLQLLEEEHTAYDLNMADEAQVMRAVALFMIFGLLSTLVILYVNRFQQALAQSLTMVTGVCVLVLFTLLLGLLLSMPPWYAVFLPMTITAMVLTLAYNPQFALLMSFSLAFTISVANGTDVEHVLIQMAGVATAVLLLRNVRTRTQLVQVASLAGLAYLAMTVATGLVTGQTWNLIGADSLRHFVWGSLAGFLLTGLLPLVERCFNIVTDISLLELADGSHPLLQELVRRAPGTYTHSITVATLAEGAADAIGANPLLVRVGAYFHDIGKMLKPHYFIENQNGENRHAELEPALSTLVIIGHVKDGCALAQQYALPKPIIDFIAQHHGTTLVEFFYREALRLQEAIGSASADLESVFRYPGPKPQTREHGILMLADCVESASRSLANPTPGSLNKLVHDLLMKRLLDGQFEESGLTLTELHTIEESLSKSLIALFHHRIKYPEDDIVLPKAA
ncbi:MAG: HDIG domain-containing protein [Planctomycetes bacterium]|nr:HDIG domain-containing protein [Planctomycetota bacterium]